MLVDVDELRGTARRNHELKSMREQIQRHGDQSLVSMADALNKYGDGFTADGVQQTLQIVGILDSGAVNVSREMEAHAPVQAGHSELLEGSCYGPNIILRSLEGFVFTAH